jgi:hypothetical protein
VALHCQWRSVAVVVPVLALPTFVRLRCSFLLPVLNFNVSLFRCLLGCGNTGWLVAEALASDLWHDYFLDLVPEQSQRFLDNLRGLLGFLAALGCDRI